MTNSFNNLTEKIKLEDLPDLLNQLHSVDQSELERLEKRIKLCLLSLYDYKLEKVKSVTHDILEELLKFAYSNIEPLRKNIALNLCRMLYNGLTCKMLKLDSAKLALLEDDDLAEQLGFEKEAFIVLRKATINQYKELINTTEKKSHDLLPIKIKFINEIKPQINTTLTFPQKHYNFTYREIVFQTQYEPETRFLLSLSNDIYLGILLIENKIKSLKANPKQDDKEIKLLENALGKETSTNDLEKNQDIGLYGLRAKYQKQLRQPINKQANEQLLAETHSVIANKIAKPLQKFYANRPQYKRLLDWAENFLTKIISYFYSIPFTRQTNLTIPAILEAAKEKIVVATKR